MPAESPWAPNALALPPALLRVAMVARALGPLNERIVFIGGAIAPLLHSQPALPVTRPTVDVDAVIATSSYGDIEQLSELLRRLGFVQDRGLTAHVHRWLSPDGIQFDLVPAGRHLGASGNQLDVFAVANAVHTRLLPGLVISHVSAVGFLALKWAAFRDRGAMDPRSSRDLEDIVALIASRPTIVEEIVGSGDEIRCFVAERTRAFLEMPDTDGEELIDACLGYDVNARQFTPIVFDAMRAVATTT